MFGRGSSRAQEPLDNPQASLIDPGLAQADPRQLLYELGVGSGLSLVVHAPMRADALLEAALRAMPLLNATEPKAVGFGVLRRDPATFWTLVEAPAGSAVVVFFAPDTDSMMAVQDLMDPADRAPAPLRRSLMMQGTVDAEVATLLSQGEVVPPWDLAALRHLAEDEGYESLPVTLRRELTGAGWERLAHDLYLGDLPDDDGTIWRVFANLRGRRPSLELPLKDADLVTFGALAERGHYVEALDDGGLLVGTMLETHDLASVIRTFQGLMRDLLAVRDAPVDVPLPAPPPTGSIWSRLENPGRTSSARTLGSWASGVPEYTYCERFWELLPDGQDGFAEVDDAARLLLTQTGAGFEYSWRDQQGRRLDPTWTSTRSAVLDAESGRVVAASVLTHRALGRADAYDLGAVDGRNMGVFPEAGHSDGLIYPTAGLYVGSTATGSLLPLELGSNVGSVDHDPASGTTAVYETWGSGPGSIAVVRGDGILRRLTYVGSVYGGEQVTLSPDASWILLAGSSDTVLVEVDSGRFIRLDGVASATWWPARDSALLVLANRLGKVVPRIFDLAVGDYVEDLPALAFDCPVAAELSHTFFPQVSPDSRELLAVTFAGNTVEHQRAHGARPHVVRVDLTSGRAHVSEPFWADEHRHFEREHLEPRWTRRPGPCRVQLAAALAGRLSEPVLTSESSTLLWSDEAVALAGAAVDALVGELDSGAPPDRLLPEVLAAATVVARDPEGFERLATWLTRLQRLMVTKLEAGELTGDTALAWRTFCGGLAALKVQRPNLVDPLAWAARVPGHKRPAARLPVPSVPPLARTPRCAGGRTLRKGENAPVEGNEVSISLTLPPLSTDVSALLLDASGHVRGDEDFVFYNNPVGPGVTCDLAQSVVRIDTSQVPADVHRVRIVVSTDSGRPLVRIGQIEAAAHTSGAPISYAVDGLTEEQAVIVCEVYRRESAWKVRAVGQGYAGGLATLLTDHGLQVG